MSAQTASGTILGTTSVTAPPPVLDIPTEFMDVGGKYTFRAYLTDAPPNEHALRILVDTLAEIVDTHESLSNEQLYDQLHARLCGPEPLEREPLLAFMKLCIQAIRDLIANRAQAELPTNQASWPSRETVPDGSLARLSLAKIFPRQVLCFLQAIEQVVAASPKSGLILQLAEFIGCTDLEISQLLETTTEKVETRRIAVKKDAWRAYDQGDCT